MATSGNDQQGLDTKATAIDESNEELRAIDRQSEGQATGASREDRIREAAYALADARGFAPGYETEDWLTAERMLGEEGDKATPLGEAR